MEAEALDSLPLRHLTPREWERLQGFPDGWTAEVGISDTRCYRCLGNDVTVGVVQTVVRKMKAVAEETCAIHLP